MVWVHVNQFSRSGTEIWSVPGPQGLLGVGGSAVQVVAGATPVRRTEGAFLSSCNHGDHVKVTCATELHDFNIKDCRSYCFKKAQYLLICGCLFYISTQRLLMKCDRLSCHVTVSIIHASVCVWAVRGPMEPHITPTCSRHRSMSIRTSLYCLASRDISRRPDPIDLLCAGLCLSCFSLLNVLFQSESTSQFYLLSSYMFDHI